MAQRAHIVGQLRRVSEIRAARSQVLAISVREGVTTSSQLTATKGSGLAMARLRARSWGLRSALVAATLAAVAGCLSGSPVRVPPAAPAAQPTELPPSAAATWYPAGQLPAANAAFSVAPYFVTIDSQRQGEPAIVTDALTGKVLASVSPPTGSTGFIGVAAADDDHTFVLAAQSRAAAVGFYELRLGPAGRPPPAGPLPVPTRAYGGGGAGAGGGSQLAQVGAAPARGAARGAP